MHDDLYDQRACHRDAVMMKGRQAPNGLAKNSICQVVVRRQEEHKKERCVSSSYVQRVKEGPENAPQDAAHACVGKRLYLYGPSDRTHRNQCMKLHWKRSLAVRTIVVAAGVYIVLLIPDLPRVSPVPATRHPFVWNQDARWEALEQMFVRCRQSGCDSLCEDIQDALKRGIREMNELGDHQHVPDDTLFTAIEEDVFRLAAMVGACTHELLQYSLLASSLREKVKDQSIGWDMNSVNARSRMYRLLYGTRAALEEVMLQENPDSLMTTMVCTKEGSHTPTASLMGIEVHSGDILVSRGVAPTSALIARGNDFPGNFSHVALLHVDAETHSISIIESHIERGVAVSTVDDYLHDTKLRVMILRLRTDLPSLIRDPLLPQKAASWVLAEAHARHIPYDFAMDFSDSTRWSCSEVVSTAYKICGIHLWMGLSSISSPALATWLAAFGVEHFETQEPSDLESDPQLRVIAEWRDPEALFQDHLDNAVIDARLERADLGERLGYRWYALPLARIVKAYSLVMNGFGAVGPVPEGMTATTALIHSEFVSMHSSIKARVLQWAEEFRKSQGYRAPYWELLKFARSALMEKQ